MVLRPGGARADRGPGEPRRGARAAAGLGVAAAAARRGRGRRGRVGRGRSVWWLVESGVTAWIRAAAPRGPRTHSRAAAAAAARASPGTGSGGSRAAARRPPACLPARQPPVLCCRRHGRAASAAQRPPRAGRGTAPGSTRSRRLLAGNNRLGSPGLGFICNVQHISHAHKAGGKGGGAGKRPLPVVPGLGVEAMFASPAAPAGPPATLRSRLARRSPGGRGRVRSPPLETLLAGGVGLRASSC